MTRGWFAWRESEKERERETTNLNVHNMRKRNGIGWEGKERKGKERKGKDICSANCDWALYSFYIVSPELCPERMLQSSKYCHVLFALVALDFFAFFRLYTHNGDAFVSLDLVVVDTLKTGMALQMLHHPAMQILDIRNGVDFAPRFHDKGVLGIQRRAHNARFVLALLEMRIGKAQENLVELLLAEKIGEEFHRVGAYAGDVLIVCFSCSFASAFFTRNSSGMLCAQGARFVLDEFGHGGANFHAEDESVGKFACEGETEAAEAAANVCDGDLFG